MLFRRPPIPRTETRAPSAPREATSLTLRVDGREVVVTLRRDARARRYTLRVRAASRDVVLTMPARGSLKEATAFAERHTGWIAVRLAQLPVIVAFAPGAVVPLRGVPHRIAHRPGARGTVWAETDAEGQALLCVAGEAAHVARRVADFLKREARRDLTEASRRHALALGVTISRITLRDTASRWGSCSSTGGLSYSWRLILAPPEVLDYLAAHEVAHRREMNHGPRFWATVDRLFPRRHEAEAWLKRRGAELHRFGAEAE
ncbi:M48 family metallopeptidase [Ancylobacter defluvii]|uniref:Metal-dependent hydrolase n=1 Tax=Ancylobacter defluvii TaxID=1282440 RepID=A0A9W6K007_9HYPH|nr:SprT family zinc-dependent metalloprotease [Ancylobacter defluvii]MBS7589603.1 M48 family metallopeptidase [Ancylobacter defluvii]GLK85220.1 metal-dependent hydrolase [Ancylobacter defluvii]